MLQSALVEVIHSNIMPVKSSRRTIESKQAAAAAWNEDIWRKAASASSSSSQTNQQEYLRDFEMEGLRLVKDSGRELPPPLSEGNATTTNSPKRNSSLHMPDLVYQKPKAPREPKESALISFAHDRIHFPSSSSLKPRETSLGTRRSSHPNETNNGGGNYISTPILSKPPAEPISPASPLSPPILKNIASLTPNNRKLTHSDRDDFPHETPNSQRMVVPHSPYHQTPKRNQLTSSSVQTPPASQYNHRSVQGHHQGHQPSNRSSWTVSSSRTCCTPSSSRPSLQQLRQHQEKSFYSPSSSVMSSSSRPAPEVLKTLLRKKACLYEPGTSRAITLITWLIGRDLALRKGYFTRQDLQTGVHAIVSNKIDSGFVTRTKVNRCMQIILNSCFHYIIPKPDGTEESGDTFREEFTNSVVDDTYLLHSLLSPWQELDLSLSTNVEKDVQSPSRNETENEVVEGSQKRLVLLCFNENVRSAKDVLRCHNEFIRDAANSANLHLSAEEWNSFYSKRDDDGSQGTPITSDSTKSDAVISSPLSRDAEGGDNSFFTFDIPPEVSQTLSLKENDPMCGDMFGTMNTLELAEFRSTWCCKRYDHDIEKCKFAHVDVNLGWLRRDPRKYDYKPILCQKISCVPVKDRKNHEYAYVNACEHGNNCKFAHSQEEINYHPLNYKKKECKSVPCCQLRDICPCVHRGHHHISSPMVRSPRILRSPKGSRASNQGMPPMERSAKSIVSNGTPMMYINPAPESECERRLRLPGLRTLFRQNCGAHYAATLPGNTTIPYTYFGDTNKTSRAESE